MRLFTKIVILFWHVKSSLRYISPRKVIFRITKESEAATLDCKNIKYFHAPVSFFSPSHKKVSIKYPSRSLKSDPNIFDIWKNKERVRNTIRQTYIIRTESLQHNYNSTYGKTTLHLKNVKVQPKTNIFCIL